MQNPEAELRSYRKQIYNDISLLLNPRLRFLTDLTDHKNRDLWQAFGGEFYIIYHSLFDNLIITLSWIYSESTKDKRRLRWYLEQVKLHTTLFSPLEIDMQHEEINNLQSIIAKIKNVRDKWVGHRDPVAFNSPEEFLKENDIELQDFEKLIRLAEKILQIHTNKFDDIELSFSPPYLVLVNL